MNHSDSERVVTVLIETGLKEAERMESADVIIFNTCSVRQSAEDRIFGLKKNIRELKTANSLRIMDYRLPITVITGCLCKRSWDDSIPKTAEDERKYIRTLKRRMPWADIILQIKDIQKLPELITGKLPYHTIKQPSNYLVIKPTYRSEFSAFIPISTGCDEFCTYCIVPKARGKQIDRPAKVIISEVKDLISKGYKDIFLLGQSVNSWKNPENKYPKTFTDLLKEIDSIEGNYWLSFLSSHPKHFGKKLIEYFASSVNAGLKAIRNNVPHSENDHIRPYLNLALQSGSDRILKKMNRRYSAKDFVEIVKSLRGKIPGLKLSTDIIVGFPRETANDFKETLELIRKVELDMAYINKYSSRTGTASSLMEDTVSWGKKGQRDKKANKVLEDSARKRNKENIGMTTRALITKFNKKEQTASGKTFNFKDIRIKLSPKAVVAAGEFVNVVVKSTSGWSLSGSIVKGNAPQMHI